MGTVHSVLVTFVAHLSQASKSPQLQLFSFMSAPFFTIQLLQIVLQLRTPFQMYIFLSEMHFQICLDELHKSEIVCYSISLRKHAQSSKNNL